MNFKDLVGSTIGKIELTSGIFGHDKLTITEQDSSALDMEDCSNVLMELYVDSPQKIKIIIEFESYGADGHSSWNWVKIRLEPWERKDD